MDHNRFQEAQQAYDAGDFRLAAKLFLAAAGRGADGNGGAYHMAGNSLMRLRRHQDALTVYGHALRDGAYDKRGAVYTNLGAAHVALADYAEASRAYESALKEADYATPYKAYQGLAGSLLERGHIEEAAVAYRRAALDPGNPDPGKALVNLGLCFMGLNRPEDAVEAYRAALGFDEYQGRGKALANLGQAYAAMGEYEESVRAFEKSTQLHNHRLSSTAAATYDVALAKARPQREVVEGWETGEIGFVAPLTSDDTHGWESAELAALTATLTPTSAPEADTRLAEAEKAAASLGFGDETAVADFFSITDEQMRDRDRDVRRAEREGNRGSGWKPVAVVAAVIVAIVAVIGGAYWFGLGWPTQQQSTAGMLVAHRDGEKVDTYWVAVPGKDLVKEMAKVPPVKSYTIDGVTRGPQDSTVRVTVTPKEGAALHYTVTLAREGVGWKVSGVENDWRSTDGGS